MTALIKTIDLPNPTLSFPIHRLSASQQRYLLYDINTITWLRRTHHILGVLIGTLPQIPQQNVFLGLPLELMPEEARLLAEKGLAYIVDDQTWHEQARKELTLEERRRFVEGLRNEEREMAIANEKWKSGRAEAVRKKVGVGKKGEKKDKGGKKRMEEDLVDEVTNETVSKELVGPATHVDEEKIDEDGEESLFDAAPPQSSSSSRKKSKDAPTSSPKPPDDVSRVSPAPSISTSTSMGDVEPYLITPTLSTPPFRLPPPPSSLSNSQQSLLPTVSAPSYALFRHLHSHGYFMSPGLRFGCQFLVYPGDPLRFHSHFLAVAYGWEEEFDLLDLVGGGRLGTGVKKGWLLGGVEPGKRKTGEINRSGIHDADVVEEADGEGEVKGETDDSVRTFCIEWAGM
ncbi:tRNA-splicing endonuclease subunit [Agyrium rufum]|nr:tRNA-splicing endonuclease subunit [Agyrium rufum]